MIIPRSRPLVRTVPKEHNFRVEAGRYKARIHKITTVPRQNASGCVENLRISFEVFVPGEERHINLAKAEFPYSLEHGSDLHNVLTRLLGRETLLALSGQDFDFETLLGKEVDVEVEHVITEKRALYEYPLVKICDIQPPGTFVKTVASEVLAHS
jgi:hypothetical protein